MGGKHECLREIGRQDGTNHLNEQRWQSFAHFLSSAGVKPLKIYFDKFLSNINTHNTYIHIEANISNERKTQ